MYVSSILKDKPLGHTVLSVSSDTTVADAVALLCEKRVGAVLVHEGAKTIAGILSERDVVRGLNEQGASVLDGPVSALMTANVTTTKPDDSVEYVMELMTKGRFRHLPVLDKDAVIGIVSIGDVVKLRIQEAEQEAASLREYVAGNM